MENKIIEAMKKIVGNDWVASDAEKIDSYVTDETEQAIAPVPCFDCIVVKPADANEISEILKYANDEKCIVIARGGGTGCTGAAVPTKPSIIMSLERLNKIIDVDEENLMVECEAGVTLFDLEDTFKSHDSLFFPVHPGYIPQGKPSRVLAM